MNATMPVFAHPKPIMVFVKTLSEIIPARVGLVIRLTKQRNAKVSTYLKGKIIEYGERIQLIGNPDSRYNQFLQTGFEEVLS